MAHNPLLPISRLHLTKSPHVLFPLSMNSNRLVSHGDLIASQLPLCVIDPYLAGRSMLAGDAEGAMIACSLDAGRSKLVKPIRSLLTQTQPYLTLLTIKPNQTQPLTGLPHINLNQSNQAITENQTIYIQIYLYTCL